MSNPHTQFPDVQAVREQARKDWEKRTINLAERIGRSIPWWLVIIALMFFLLSMPHTANTFNKLTPGFGYVAPLGVEFGLLYAAFWRKQQGKISLWLWALQVLLFVTAVIVNGAGSFDAVVSNTSDVQGLSLGQIVSVWSSLPATSQVALVLAPIAALIIPIGTVVAGEGLAALVLDRAEHGDVLEDRWQAEGPAVVFEALRDAALSSGITPRRAVKWAEQITGYSQERVSVSETTHETLETPRETKRHGRVKLTAQQKRERVRQHFEEFPEDVERSLRSVADDIPDVSYSTVRRVKEELFSDNGHDIKKEFDR